MMYCLGKGKGKKERKKKERKKLSFIFYEHMKIDNPPLSVIQE